MSAMSMAKTFNDDAAFEAAIQRERLRNARRMDAIRVIAISAMLVVFVLEMFLVNDPRKRHLNGIGPFLIVTTYWLLATGVWWFGRWSEWIVRLSSELTSHVDLLIIFFFRWSILDASGPGGIVSPIAGVVAVYAVLVAFSLWRMDPRQSIASAVMATLLTWVLFYKAGLPLSEYAWAAVLLGILGAVLVYLV